MLVGHLGVGVKVAVDPQVIDQLLPSMIKHSPSLS